MPDFVHTYQVKLTGSSLFRDEADRIMAGFAARCEGIAVDVVRISPHPDLTSWRLSGG